MGLRIEIVSRQRQNLGERGLKEFGPSGGTIGRSLESDWVLPDGQRFLSGRHASIDFHSGSYYIIDTSTNGVYINGADEPVGRGRPQRLFSGDKVRIGEYEMLVEVDTIENTRETMVDSNHIDPVDAALHVEAPDPTGLDLVNAFEITGVGFQMALDDDDADTLSPLSYKFRTDDIELACDSAPPAKPAPRIEPQAQLRPEPAAVSSASAMTTVKVKVKGEAQAATEKPPQKSPPRTPAATTPRPPEPPREPLSRANAAQHSTPVKSSNADAEQPAASSAALAAFFEGSGLDSVALNSEETRIVLHRVGQLVRELITGITESLQLRAIQKARLRQSNTTIQPRDNNSLKFSATVEEALRNLLFRQSAQYLGPVESVREAFRDLNAHQRALLSGLPQAISDYMDQLDPDALEEKFSNGKRGRLMGAANKLKYWDMYRDVYLVMAQQASDELPQPFLDALGAAYANETAAATTAATKPTATEREAV
jgi:type VI secretion system protein